MDLLQSQQCCQGARQEGQGRKVFGFAVASSHNCQRDATVVSCLAVLHTSAIWSHWLRLCSAADLFKNPYIHVFCKTNLSISSTQVLPHLQGKPVGENLKHFLSVSQ